MRLRILLVLGAALALLVGVASAAADGGHGNSDAAKQCQKGGWTSLQTDTGGTFANQGACVSYAAQGGTIYAPTLTVTSPIHASGPGSISGRWTVTGAGFHASSRGKLTYSATPWGSNIVDSLPTTDVNGNFTFTDRWYVSPFACEITVTFTFTDSHGVSASATQLVYGGGDTC